MISRRLSDLSYDEEIFNSAKPEYEKLLKESGYTDQLSFNKSNSGDTKQIKNRKRNIIWYNPPFSQSVETNLAKTFLNLVKKHFPPSSRYHKIFNKNNVKVSYSCLENMETKIKKHNKSILYPNTNSECKANCNCRCKEQCPVNGDCREKCVVYECTVISKNANISEKNYKGVAEGEVKQRIACHQTSFGDKKYKNATELSKYIWDLKEKDTEYELKWKILDKASPYQNGSKRCSLCLMEKFYIINADNNTSLNKRSELVSKCRHENKFYLSNFKASRKKPRQ